MLVSGVSTDRTHTLVGRRTNAHDLLKAGRAQGRRNPAKRPSLRGAFLNLPTIAFHVANGIACERGRQSAPSSAPFFRQACQAATGWRIIDESARSPPMQTRLALSLSLKVSSLLGIPVRCHWCAPLEFRRMVEDEDAPVNLCAAFGARPSAVAAPSLREFPEYINRVAPIVR